MQRSELSTSVLIDCKEINFNFSFLIYKWFDVAYRFFAKTDTLITLLDAGTSPHKKKAAPFETAFAFYYKRISYNPSSSNSSSISAPFLPFFAFISAFLASRFALIASNFAFCSSFSISRIK